MSELKLPRLLAAAKEFNIGQDTLVDFLVAKGANRDDLKPTAKLTERMYRALQQEFQGDKVAKNKADQIEIPKSVGEKKRKEEELAIAAEKASKEKQVKEETVEEPIIIQETKPAPIPVPVEVKPVVEQVPVPVPVPVPAPAPAPEPVVIVVAPKEEEKEKKEKEEKTQEEPIIKPVPPPPAKPTIVKIEAPEIEGPKIINKIDLSTIDSSTRPKKGVKAAQKKEIKKVIPPVEVKKTVEQHRPIQDVNIPEPAPQEHVAPIIENIKAEKLEGPKILGKIELPVDSNTRPKQGSHDEKRKRKRIPIDKKGDTETQQGQRPGGGGQQQTGGYNRPGGGQQQTGGYNRPGGGQQQTGGGYNRGGGATGGQRPGGGQQQGGGFNRGGGATGGQRPGGGQYQGARTGTGRSFTTGDREINQKEIQEKIRQTQAKLSGGSSGGGRSKNLKAKRRAKREGMAEAIGQTNEDNKLHVTEFVTVSELANLMDVSFAEVISKCMSLGIMVSINQRLDAEVIELVSGEFGFEVEFIGLDDVGEEEDEEKDDPENMQPRPPIVTIMGHVDHGKTSLLDYIRDANVVAGEAGGITQHIGAYQVTTAQGRKITFLDTPGHEAFTAMRARGAKAADIAVIVVAADDAVMPQTREAISHAQAANVPMIFAINKIDKDGANAKKIYEQLSQMNILVEEWGGKFQSQELSAKKGINIDLLLEKILLETDLLEMKANPNKDASGSIIEASLDKGRGYVANVLVENGTLNQGDLLVSGQYYGRIKAMFNERNQRIETAPPATPVQILGLNGAPQAGEKFKVYEEEAEAKEMATKRAQIFREQGLRARKHITLDEIGRRLALGNFKELNVIIKGDVDGSVEALSDSLQKLSTQEIAIRVVHKAVGQISESDVLLATASDAILIGFNVRPSVQANRLAETEGVQIKTYSIIYNAIEEIKSAMEGMLEPKFQEKVVANVEIREVYKFDKATVAGCYVLEGKIARNAKIRIIRDGIVEFPKGEGQSGELGSLKRFKDDAKDVATGYECGLTIKNFSDLRVGDIVEAFEEEEIKRTL